MFKKNTHQYRHMSWIGTLFVIRVCILPRQSSELLSFPMETRSYYPNGKSSYNYVRNKHEICKFPQLVWSWSLHDSEVCLADFSLRINTYQDWGVHDDDDDGKARYTRLSLRCGLRYLYDRSSNSSLIYKSRDSSCSLSNLDEDSHPAQLGASWPATSVGRLSVWFSSVE